MTDQYPVQGMDDVPPFAQPALDKLVTSYRRGCAASPQAAWWSELVLDRPIDADPERVWLQRIPPLAAWLGKTADMNPLFASVVIGKASSYGAGARVALQTVVDSQADWTRAQVAHKVLEDLAATTRGWGLRVGQWPQQQLTDLLQQSPRCYDGCQLWDMHGVVPDGPPAWTPSLRTHPSVRPAYHAVGALAAHFAQLVALGAAPPGTSLTHVMVDPASETPATVALTELTHAAFGAHQYHLVVNPLLPLDGRFRGGRRRPAVCRQLQTAGGAADWPERLARTPDARRRHGRHGHAAVAGRAGALVTVAITVWRCEWCSPPPAAAPVTPDKTPTQCRIVYCPRCRAELWHWPDTSGAPPATPAGVR